MSTATRRLAAAVLAGAAFTMAAPAAADCTTIDGAVRVALSDKRVAAYDDLYRQVLAEPSCEATYRDRVGRAMARSVLTTIARDAPPAVIEATIRFGRPWQVLVALGDAHFDRQSWAAALGVYEEALDDMRNVAANPKPPPEHIERRTYKRAVEARALAPTFIATRQVRGRKTGLASPTFRNFATEAVPVPVQFDFASARLTDQGFAAVMDMLAYLAVSHPDFVRITGHTDPVGSEPFNEKLSRDRAITVADALRGAGYGGVIETVGRGEIEPFLPDDASKYTTEQLHAFDRRVEYSTRR
ncbi:MAG: OmpA family protein [Alphaproteobacteria bacterium]